MSVHSRLLSGLLAGAFGQLVTIGVQLGSLPMFLWAWGPRHYGEWLLLSAIPAYLALSDMGFSSVAANQMTMDLAAGRRLDALRVFQSTLAIVTLASLVVVCISLILGFLPVERWLNLGAIGHPSASTVLLWMSAQVGLGFFGGLLSAAYRCEGDYARVTLLSNLLRLAEFLGTVVTLIAGGNLVALATVVTGIRALGTLGMRLDLKRIAPWVEFNFKMASTAEVRRLTSPALAFAIWPLAAALQQQGLVLVIGSVLGATAVVVWSACRTVARALFQAAGILNGALWPELSRSLGIGDFDLSRRLHRLAISVSLWVVAPFSVVLFLLRDLIFRYWSHGVIAVSAVLFGLTLIQTVINLLWGASSVVAAAVNRHQRNSICYVLLIVAGVSLAFPLTRVWGLPGATVSLLIADMCMLPIALATALFIVRDEFGSFIRVASLPPVGEARAALRRLLA
jgi:O-antigen/teichoic acid export membrane protein